MIYILSAEEIHIADSLARARQSEATSNGRTPSLNEDPTLESRELPSHILGMRAQLAVSKVIQREWHGIVGNFSRPHIGSRFVVRAVQTGDLPVKLRYPDHFIHIWTHVDGSTVEIYGWIRGRVAKKVGLYDNPGGFGPAYFVPDWRLRPIEELIPRPSPFDPSLLFARIP